MKAGTGAHRNHEMRPKCEILSPLRVAGLVPKEQLSFLKVDFSEDSCGPWETRVLLDPAPLLLSGHLNALTGARPRECPALNQHCLDRIEWERPTERRSCDRYHVGSSNTHSLPQTRNF